MSFTSLGLNPDILSALADLDYVSPTPIQQKAIPAILAGKDVLGIAKTGTGKTLSYVLPVMMHVSQRKVSNRHIAALVIVPTRELAAQVNEVFDQFKDAFGNKVKSLAVYGGVSINPQMIGLQNVQVVVATPGRLLELVENKAVHLSEVSMLVLDEADKMLGLGFKDEVDSIIKLLPERRQNLLFSATLNPDVQAIHRQFLQAPTIIEIDNDDEESIKLIKQTAYLVTPARKGPLLRYLIKHFEMKQVLVFTSSVYQADNVVDKLKKNGVEALAIHSKKSQGARTQALAGFKNGKVKVLVATDLLARGIDIELLPYVINYELPRSPKDFVHRVGRTGRAETEGEAITLVTPEEMQHFGVIIKKMKIDVPLLHSDELNLLG